jgi:putative membrane protein
MIDWTHWHNEPYLVGGLIMLGWLYALLTGPLRPRLTTEVFSRKQAFCFYGALFIFYLAVGSPLDQIGERFLLSAHMVQHQLLIYGSAVLFLLGLPAWLFTPLLRPAFVRSFARFLAHPLICAIVFILTLSIWHVPGLYDLALQNKAVHVLEHIMFFGAALFYWQPLLSPAPELPRLNPGAQLIYLVAVTIGMTPLFAFLAFSDNILYPTYEYAPRIIANFQPMDDQLLGAAIMKLGSLAVTFIAMVVAFYRWYQTTERRPVRSATAT